MQLPFSLFKHSNQILGVDISEQDANVALVRSVFQKSETRIADAELLTGEEDEQLVHTLSRRIKDIASLRIPVVSVLSTQDYQLLQIQPPQVKESEMKMAVGWQIKDLITLPLNQTLIDYFPAPAVPGQEQMIYVVAADMQAVQRRVDFLQQAKLKIRAIDIPELVLRNIVRLEEESAGNLALLYMEQDSGIILIFKKAALCLSRKVRTGWADLQPEDRTERESELLESEDTISPALESILLDLQRTFDYFESNFRSNPVSTLLLDPQLGDAPELQDYLQQNLDLSVRLLDIQSIIGQELTYQEQGRYLFALGCSLKSG